MLMNVMTLFLARLHISFGACDDPRKKTEPQEKNQRRFGRVVPTGRQRRRQEADASDTTVQRAQERKSGSAERMRKAETQKERQIQLSRSWRQRRAVADRLCACERACVRVTVCVRVRLGVCARAYVCARACMQTQRSAARLTLTW